MRLRLPRNLSAAQIAKIAALVLVFLALLVFDIVVPLTPVEQQGLVGLVITLGVIALWLF